MASSILAVQGNRSSRRTQPMQNLGWIPVALGAAAIVAGLEGRKKGAVALVLTAFAGVAAVGTVRGVQLGRGKANTKGQGGTLSVLGVYGLIDKFQMGAIMNKGMTVRSTQQHGQAYMDRLLALAQKGELNLAYLVTHRFSLEDAPRGYDMLKHKTDGCMRAVFAP